MTPIEQYQQNIAEHGFATDASQALAMIALQKLYDELIKKPSWLKFLQKPIQGIYLWGGVGRGKSYLMDLFFESLPFKEKQRLHFHKFMQRVHVDLQALSGEKNPLEKVAKRISKEVKIICFDEFFVEDITDAMLLAGLLKALFSENIVLVATSNIEPDKLYQKGILRERFLPAIALLKQHCEIIHVDGGIDYRLRMLQQAHVYEVGQANGLLSDLFTKLAVGVIQPQLSLTIYDRLIQTILTADNIVWFDFSVLCETARSQYDYLEIAAVYAMVMVSDVPIFTIEKEEAARRFIHLIDVFYDNNIKLIMTAAALPQALYQGKRFVFEFQRTQSRLQEMQTQAYLERAHTPLNPIQTSSPISSLDE